MGGMAAQIPIRSDEKANEEALAKVRADKEREVGDGHDGTWVAHPGLVPIAKAAFDDRMPNANQVARQRQDVHVTAYDLLKIPEGRITEQGLRTNLRSEEHTSELQSLMRISYAVFCLKKKKKTPQTETQTSAQHRKHNYQT